MAFDDFMKGMRPKVTSTPEIVEVTFATAQKLMNTDYLDKIKNIKLIMPFLKRQTEMNIFKRGWRFNFGTSKVWVGLCDPRDKEGVLNSKNKNILVSIEYVKGDDNWPLEMENTLHHEIAHAIVNEIFFRPTSEGTQSGLFMLDPEHYEKSNPGHGKIWQEVFKAISGKENISKTYGNANLNKKFKPFMYKCSACSHIGYLDNKFLTKSCEKCLLPIFVQDNS